MYKLQNIYFYNLDVNNTILLSGKQPWDNDNKL